MNEIWKDAWWTQGVFQVSNYGRVYNTKTKRFLKGSKNPKNGYMNIQLHYNGIKEQWTLHRLVATVWQRPLLKTEEAHHKNGLKCCNCNFNIQIKNAKLHNRAHKIGNKNRLGKHHSQETKQKISKGNKGKKFSPESIAKRTATRAAKKAMNPNYGRKKNEN